VNDAVDGLGRVRDDKKSSKQEAQEFKIVIVHSGILLN
jgi:hypothetical protein